MECKSRLLDVKYACTCIACTLYALVMEYHKGFSKVSVTFTKEYLSNAECYRRQILSRSLTSYPSLFQKRPTWLPLSLRVLEPSSATTDARGKSPPQVSTDSQIARFKSSKQIKMSVVCWIQKEDGRTTKFLEYIDC